MAKLPWLALTCGVLLLASIYEYIQVMEVINTQQPLKTMEVLIYHRGKHIGVDSRVAPGVVGECERLLTEADTTRLLIMTPDRIREIKSADAVEIVYPSIQTKSVLANTRVYFTKLLIPLSGEFANGMVFYAGSAQPGADKLNYDSLQEYGPVNFVRNTQGLEKLEEVLNGATSTRH